MSSSINITKPAVLQGCKKLQGALIHRWLSIDPILIIIILSLVLQLLSASAACLFVPCATATDIFVVAALFRSPPQRVIRV
ncbi:uncharacterized protein K460DRAFT_361029 [Cucurbitaria berberidis CBS 394.84]|uniref:Uncharacterized protein n=1 Tax=Cucurbitaria berberidis CBS 394.84 TaxID=1168544 RepID=A0A9P4LC17_9PLEO|nr:uncharacterized protein K460DRAFT_361029 [Cucurbitaria berberidis CBS 394.84]KAF1850206.1 hypothetical protein K460DRAFT_361029 [Cucurbitaria berberidis CBS 394.84]